MSNLYSFFFHDVAMRRGYAMKQQTAVSQAALDSMAAEDSSDEEMDTVMHRAQGLHDSLPAVQKSNNCDKGCGPPDYSSRKRRPSFHGLSFFKTRRSSETPSNSSDSGSSMLTSSSNSGAHEADWLANALSCTILDKDGRKHRFEEVLHQDGKTVVIFIRFYWCGLCMSYVKQMKNLLVPSKIPVACSVYPDLLQD